LEKRLRDLSAAGVYRDEMNTISRLLVRLRLGFFVAAVAVVTSISSSSLAQSPRPGIVSAPRQIQVGGQNYSVEPPPPELPRFDLDFPGGAPEDLIKTISRVQGAKVNAIIPDEHVDVKIPRLQLSHVTVPEVFTALLAANSVGTRYPISGFKSTGDGVITTNTIWTYFSDPVYEASKSVNNQKLKVFSLSRHLGKPEQGLHSVEDIITAVQTGWKMQRITPNPELTYHPETKLLMVFGSDAALTLIADVLKQLEPPAGVPVAAPTEKLNPEVMKVLEKSGTLLQKDPPKSK
jgi:hypothetical protein